MQAARTAVASAGRQTSGEPRLGLRRKGDGFLVTHMDPIDLAQINGAGDPVQRIAGDPVAVLGQCRQGCVALNLGLQAVANRGRGLSVGRERLAVYRVDNT